MSYDRQKFYTLVDELRRLNAREEVIQRELGAMFGRKTEAGPSRAKTGVKPAAGKGQSKKASAKPKAKKGELTALVLGILRSNTRPAKLETIVKRVTERRPQTTPESVATVLHGLVRKGQIAKPEPSTFQLIKTPGAAPTATVQASEGDRVPVAPLPTEPKGAVVPDPDEGVLLET